MERIVLATAIAAVAAGAAALLRARRPAPTLTTSAGVPERLDRADFDRPGTGWLYVVFSSATCESCPAAVEALSSVAAGDVVADEVEYPARRDLHEKYTIEAVPLTLLVDGDGRVRAHFVGRTDANRLAEALERARAEPPGEV